MKAEEFEQPDDLIRQKGNVEFLLNTTIPWMEDNPHRVDFRECNSNCGTYACLGGWYAVQRYGKSWEEADEDEGCSDGSCFLRGDTGIESAGSVRCKIFGWPAEGTLDDRKERLQAHLNTLHDQITDWHKARELTPESAGVEV